MNDVSFPDMTHSPGDPAALYVDLMKRCLTNWIYGPEEVRFKKDRAPLRRALVNLANATRSTSSAQVRVVDTSPYRPDARAEGRDWPPFAHTMIGLKRLDNLQRCVEAVLRENVPGDLLEAGVWRGGAGIFMRAILKAAGDTGRTVWLADSFAGLPPPDAAAYPDDAGDLHYTQDELAVSLEQVQENFTRYGLLDAQVRFLKGWFSDTLPAAPVQQLALLRADGDMYQSTMDILVNLYPKVSAGGFVIIDDYGAVEGCRKAVHDYRDAHGITEEIVTIDWGGVYWRRA